MTKRFFYVDGTVWHGSRYWKMDSLSKGEVVGWNTRYFPYTIRKITAKQITVENIDFLTKASIRIILKRDVMERTGKQYHTRFHEYFYAEKPRRSSADWNWAGSTPRLDSRDVRAVESVIVLGVRHPFSRDDVRRAYKRLARKTHPDLGGDAADFRKLKQAHDVALRFAT